MDSIYATLTEFSKRHGPALLAMSGLLLFVADVAPAYLERLVRVEEITERLVYDVGALQDDMQKIVEANHAANVHLERITVLLEHQLEQQKRGSHK